MFEIIKESGRARRGRMKLKHGVVETPIFMPVGTVASVKTLTSADLDDVGASIILGNTYHLFLRPGMEVIEHFGGLHNFMNWKKPILTDSGGYQIFSLAKLRKLTSEGVSFRSHIDGSKFELTPEKSTWIQETIGSDIHMVLDECTPYPCSVEEARKSMQLSMDWGVRCRKAKKKPDLMQFGIGQGGVYESLRKEHISFLIDQDFEGLAIGGLSVGEPKTAMREMTDLSCQYLPREKPRYLMGVGTPGDLLESVAMGVDMFDCVMPTRNARNGTLFSWNGRINIKTSIHKFMNDPIDEKCPCYTCKNHSRAYLRHLFMAKEPTIMRLLTLHNLTFYLELMSSIRKEIEQGTFDAFYKRFQPIFEK